MAVPTLENVARPRAFGFGVALDDRLFRLALGRGREMQVVTAPLEAPRVNTTSSAEEASAEFGLTFARSQFDGGEGLFRAHVEGAAPNRFWDSKGVEVSSPDPGEFPEIRLLHEVALAEATTTNSRMAHDAVNGATYVIDGTTLRRSTDLVTWADDSPAGGDAITGVNDVAAMGDVVYAATIGGGINQRVSGVWSNYDPLAADRIWAVKGRIVAAAGRSLYELDGTGVTPTAKIILPAGETWAAVADGGNAVLAGASDGYVYAFDTDTGSLVLQSQTLFETEAITALGQTQGVIGVGTRSGNVGFFYTGVLDERGQIVNQQLVRTWGTVDSATAQYPHRIIGTRSALYTGITDGVDTSLWRYDLITSGITRNLGVDGVTGQVRGIESVDGMLAFSVDGAGVYVEQTTYVAEGWLIGPLGDFYSAQEKSWIGARLETGDLDGQASVAFYRTSEPEALLDDASGDWVQITARSGGTGDPGEISMDPAVISRYLAGMVRLTSSSGRLTTPGVRSFGFRAYPSSGDEDRIVTFPVNVSDQIERRGRRRVRVKGRGENEWAALQSLAGRPILAQFFSLDLTIRGLVEEVATPVLAESRRGSPLLVSQVKVRGQIVSAGGGGSTTGTGAFGTDRMFGTDHAFGES